MKSTEEIQDVHQLMGELYDIQSVLQLCHTGTLSLQENIYAEEERKAAILLDGVQETVSELADRVGNLAERLDNPKLKLVRT